MALIAVASAVPSVRHTAADIAEITGADEAFIRDKVGISERYILGPGESGLDLAERATRKLLDKTSIGAEQIGLLIYVTQTPDRRVPGSAPALAHRIGAGTAIAAFDLALGCSGFVYALALADSFLAMHGADYGIIVTCDPYSRMMAAEDKSTNAVFGDAAAATLVRRGGEGPVALGFDFGSDGEGADAIRLDAGGALMPLVSLEGPVEGSASYPREAARLQMDGRAVFNFVNGVIPGSLENAARNAGIALTDIDYFALHQGSAYMLKALAKRVGIPPEKLLMNIDRYGNTVSSTVPMLLEELQDTHDLRGKHVLLSGFGVGLSWASCVLRFPVGE